MLNKLLGNRCHEGADPIYLQLDSEDKHGCAVALSIEIALSAVLGLRAVILTSIVSCS